MAAPRFAHPLPESRRRNHAGPNQRLRGLYAITPNEADTPKLIHQVKLALEGGTRWVQYRNKSANNKLRRRQAEALAALCSQFGAALIINDDIELTRACNAHGAHLGREDASLATARSLLGKNKIIGASCYDQIERAIEAEAQGADYVAFGSFHPSSVKSHTVRPQVQLLAQARTKLSAPIVAVGGITLENAGVLIEAGADAVAVISALFNAPDIKTAAKKFNCLFASRQ
ncbi:MAG TPA: thiamine phosphate synthase [Burkholderiales bacterium]|nr:thiamine phosphate synthase [Burkholderiales bacterium]